MRSTGSSRLLVLAIVALALPACGDDGGADVTGPWRVIVHSIQPGDCGPGFGMTQAGPAYIEISHEGADLVFRDCGAAGTDCAAASNADVTFSAAVDGGYRSEHFAASGGGPACTLSATVAELTVAGGTLAIHILRYDVTVGGASCTPDEAHTRYTAGGLNCASREEFTASRE